MKAQVHAYVQSCFTCQQAKPDRSRLPGLLQPLPVPNGSWQVVTMDFIEGLPKSGAADCIMVVVDKFSKFAHFIPLLYPFSAATVAKLYMDHVYKLYCLPQAIITNHDRIFTSRL